MHDPNLALAPAEGPEAALLDHALAATLLPPPLPPGFRARLEAALQRQAEDSLQARREALQALHAEELALLRSGHVRLRRHTLALVAAGAFTGGAVAAAALPWLQALLGVEGGLIMPALAAAVGVAVGLGAWRLPAGRQRWAAFEG